MNGRDKIIVLKILAYCKEIQKTHIFFQDSKEFFFDHEDGHVYRNSITMSILQIGELAKNLSDEFLKNYPDIPWRQIKGMRDIFAHHYGSVDFKFVWHTSHDDIDELMNVLKRAAENQRIQG